MPSRTSNHDTDMAPPPKTAAATAAVTADDKPTDPAVKLIRAPNFRKAFEKALKHSTKNVTYDNFAACFPTTAAYNRAALKQVWQELIASFEDQTKENFDEIIENRKVLTHLNSLDQLLHEAKLRKTSSDPTSPPTPITDLSPEDILNAHLAPILAAQQSVLETQLAARQEEIDALLKTKERQRREIAELVGVLEKSLSVLDGAVESVGEVDVGGLEKEVDEMDVRS